MKGIHKVLLVLSLIIIISLAYYINDEKKDNYPRESIVWGVNFNISINNNGNIINYDSPNKIDFPISDNMTLRFVQLIGDSNTTSGSTFVIVENSKPISEQFHLNNFNLRVGESYFYEKENITIILNNITGSPCPKGSYC